MRKSSVSLRDSGTYTSPGTPDYGDNNMVENANGWSSERVSLPTNNSKGRNISGASSLMPFYSGRALPSKWDDAERWITSPVSGYGVSKSSNVQQQTHRRFKSKSGPLGAPGMMYLPNYSPPVAALEGGNVKSFMDGSGSPFTTGVLLPDGISLQYNAHTEAKSGSLRAESCVDRSCKEPESSHSQSKSPKPSSQDGRPDVAKEAETTVSRVVSRRDMATQMSPDDGSIRSSPEIISPGSTFRPSIRSATEKHSNSCRVEVRDVEEDKGAVVGMQGRKTKRGLPDVQNSASPWHVARETKNTTELKREEAKIAAWENLQKAKAEAAMRKLEAKIEKRRSESMDKILNKLRAAQVKAQNMRSSITESNSHRRTSNKAALVYKYAKMGSLSACFFHRTK